MYGLYIHMQVFAELFLKIRTVSGYLRRSSTDVALVLPPYPLPTR